ncbi:GSCFA domain-containing protein [Flavobacterium psychrotolerans]|uniref:GSCFA domain-containing protein n=1 Tax=Flavobacterium psychrotolerans TaxID=2169410 RepID=A0A2U1JII0_9FLAO|nr:GSCFA domain-containing protein [Flavobacterium psychrotolerans]PWA04956.1 GSCFA domain-containing protein [Flavobacterium psychrotolerans]
MNFFTKIPISISNYPINYHSKIVSLGSCFAVNMAEKLDYFKFQNVVNPFGIIFNPVSIAKLVTRAINHVLFAEKDLFFHNERWHCYEVHSDLSNENKDEFLENLNLLLHSTNDQITQSTHVIITYGTSWVYRNKNSNEIVANCHKVPQNQFDKALLSVEIIEKSIQESIDLIQKVNPNCNVIFTVSPVRHIKDGFVENQRSKAHLITAIHQVLQSEICSLQSTNYFPSYEILMDELRDYRFYAQDMLHPNQVAIDYIWERFAETYISEASQITMEDVNSVQKGLHHKPFNLNSDSHQQFLVKLQNKMDLLQQQFPNIQF